MTVLTAADLGRTPKGVDEEEKRQINLEIDNTESYMVTCAAAHHTVDTKVYVKSAARAVKVITELPHSSQAEQVADALERGQLALLLSNASNTAAPAAALPGSNGQVSDTEQRLQQELNATRQLVLDMLSAAHVTLRPGTQVLDNKDDILARLTEQHTWAQGNYGNTVAMTDDEIKQTQVYKDLDADKAAAEGAKTTAENAKTAAEGKIATITPIANKVKNLVDKGQTGIGNKVKFSDDDYEALETAAADLVSKITATP